MQERPEDIEPLARHFLEKYCRILDKTVTGVEAEALGVLKD
ncbi:MAG: hypothetical protein ACPLPR_06815 [Bacillota bacterium]